MRLLPLLIFGCLLLGACQRLILGEDEVNTPTNNFKIFWEDLDRHYSLFGVRGLDWDSIRTSFEPRFTPALTDEEVYALLSEMIAYLDDSHSFVLWPGRDIFVSGAGAIDQAMEEFSIELIKDKYIEVIAESQENTLLYGRFLGRDISYIHFPGIDLDDPDVMDEILKKIGNHKAMIMDLRNNTGGDDVYGASIAGRFITEEKLLYTVQERNGPDPDDFAEKKEFFSQKLGKEHFVKPLVILTDQMTVSAAEVMLLYLKSVPTATQIGTVTAGDFSDTGMRRFLPNNFQYQYSIMKFLLPDGTSLDGVGHLPDIEVRNTATGIAAGNDVVLERAFQFLFEEYGIE